MQLKHTFNSFWSGDLPPYARLAMNSYVKQGHKFLLWTYESLDGVPEGVIVKDANEIIPQEAVYNHGGWRQNLSFSDWFRYKLLYNRGGWWVDTDAVLMPNATVPQGDYLFWAGSSPAVNNGIMKVPAGSRFLWELCQFYENPTEANFHWVKWLDSMGEERNKAARSASLEDFRNSATFSYGGTYYLGMALHYYKLSRHVIPYDTPFPQATYPAWNEVKRIFNGELKLQDLAEKNCWNVHLYGSCIRRDNLWDSIEPGSVVDELIQIFGC